MNGPETVAAGKEPKPKATASITIPKKSGFKTDLSGIESEQEITIVAKGKVSSFRDDQYEKSMSLDLSSVRIVKGKNEMTMKEYKKSRNNE